jgi:SAM-dependent methyltransferase
MRIAHRIRKIYERRPYPPPALRAAVASWSLPPLEWIDTVRENPQPLAPARILVAGCGVGTEAFAVAQRFSDAEVVAVDFSARSIATARRLQRTADGGERVRFEVADLASPRLIEMTGDRFDLVSCHGVLSYVPDTGAALRNFARCLTPAGILVLGVNGAAHPSVRWRRVLNGFGIDEGEFREGDPVRQVLRVCDSLSLYPPVPIAEMDAGYLAGDIFGPLNQSLPLEEWNDFFRDAGLHVLGNYHAFFAVRALLNRDLHVVVMPRSRAEMGELVDLLQPASFHRLILSRRPAIETPWNDATKLLRRRPLLTPLFKPRWPRGGGASRNLRNVTLKSPSTATAVDLRVPQWEVEVLRRADGERSLREILEAVRPPVPAKVLREAMYLLYLLGVLNFLPESA